MNTVPPHAENSNAPLLYCPKCTRDLPATTKYYHRNRSRASGFQTYCKQCLSGKDPDAPVEEIPEGHKRCTGPCGRLLLATSEFFYHNKGTTDGLLNQCKQCRVEKDKAYYNEHHEERVQSSKTYYYTHYEERTTANLAYSENHREELRQYAAGYREENRERINAWQTQYYEVNREEINLKKAKRYEENPEPRREQSRRYHQTERGRIVHRTASQNRRARKRNAQGTHTTQELYQQLERQKHKCYWCHKKLGKGRASWHADHIVPLIQGGSNSIDNIVISCPTCNLKRKGKLPHQWPQGGRLL